ncbi:uncharacterized protein [Nothobranchius furzeri]|uniref:uncharacterized protein isoform X2 n=1 Tax=Nothobranchius furzeri TaxID=105023 RepID=UPI003904D14A
MSLPGHQHHPGPQVGAHHHLHHEKAQKKRNFLRQLKKFNLPAQTMRQFCTSVIRSILTSSVTVWYAGATIRDKRKLQRVVRSAEKVIGCKLPSIEDFTSRTLRRAGRITVDLCHSGHSLFDLLPGRRLRSIHTITSRHKNSFFHSAVRLLNVSCRSAHSNCFVSVT